MKRLGFLGLGAMGAPIAGNLAGAGFELAVFDVDERRTQETARALGVRAAGSAADAAIDADALVVMVTDGAQAQTALLGDNGAAAALPAQAAVVLMSTVGAEAVGVARGRGAPAARRAGVGRRRPRRDARSINVPRAARAR